MEFQFSCRRRRRRRRSMTNFKCISTIMIILLIFVFILLLLFVGFHQQHLQQSTSPSSSPIITGRILPPVIASDDDEDDDPPSVAPTVASPISTVPSDFPSLDEPASLTPTVVSPPSLMPSSGLLPSGSPTILFVCKVNFTLVLLTDKYPVETSWSLTNIVTSEVIGEGSGYQNENEEYVELVECLLFNSCYVFEILDKWEDGICCDNGSGSYTGFLTTYDEDDDESAIIDLPIPGLNSGAFFTDSKRHTFCLDEDGILLVEGFD
jgi:hypothetical protein